MISDRDAAALACGIYSYSGLPVVAWDHLDPGDDDGVYWAIKYCPEADVLVFRGSVTLQDWLRDFAAFADPCDHSELGPVHPGFLMGLEQVRDEVRPLLRSGMPLVVVGHSLGAGRASIMTGLLVTGGLMPAARFVYGEPRPGFAKLAAIVSRVPGSSYCNGNGRVHDPVTDVPFTIGFESYCHPTPLLPVCAAPAAGDNWGPAAWHHMQLYQAAIDALPPPSILSSTQDNPKETSHAF